jgi:hypothetical protein
LKLKYVLINKLILFSCPSLFDDGFNYNQYLQLLIYTILNYKF